MASVLTDIFIMESYVNEKARSANIDSLTFLKKSLYAPILKYHKVDSVDFYTTFNYYQAHPKEFSQLLSMIDSTLGGINPKDTTIVRQLVEPPKNIDMLDNFREQEAAMREEFLKKNKSSQKFKNRKGGNE